MKQVNVGKHILRLAEIKDIPQIMGIIEKYMDSKHLLTRDRACFEYDFVTDGNVNFLVAEHMETGEIDAIEGFVRCSEKQVFDIFPSYWLSKPKTDTRFLGVEMGKNILGITGARHKAGVGITDMGAKISELFLKLEVKIMPHYYRLAARDDFYIAEINENKRIECEASEKWLIPIPTPEHLDRWFDFSALPDIPMYKDRNFVVNRYFRHPYYKFNIWGIEDSPGSMTGLLVGRVVCHNNSKALRIMDFFGPDCALIGIGTEIDLYMEACGIEYTDFYCAGIEREYLERAGFTLRDENDPNIIPNHFEPYEKKNVNIYYNGCSYNGKDVRAFKGDGDQGRPRLLRLPEQWRV